MRLAPVVAFLFLAACGPSPSDKPPCNNACSAGGTQCSGDQAQTCAADSNGCLAWSSPTACPTGKTCTGNGCVDASCSATCKGCCDGEACLSGSEIAKCGNAGGSCFSCGSGQGCSGGKCVGGTVCTGTNACAAGAVQCVSGLVQRCSTGSDGCLAWATTKTCGAGETCGGGGDPKACGSSSAQPTCTDLCRDADACGAKLKLPPGSLSTPTCVTDCEKGKTDGTCKNTSVVIKCIDAAAVKCADLASFISDFNACPTCIECASTSECTGGKACVGSKCCDSAKVCGSTCCSSTQSCVGGACCDAPCGAVCCSTGSTCIADASGNKQCAKSCSKGSQCTTAGTCCAHLSDDTGACLASTNNTCLCETRADCAGTDACTPWVQNDVVTKKIYSCKPNNAAAWNGCHTGSGVCGSNPPYDCLEDSRGNQFCSRVCSTSAQCGGVPAYCEQSAPCHNLGSCGTGGCMPSLQTVSCGTSTITGRGLTVKQGATTIDFSTGAFSVFYANGVSYWDLESNDTKYVLEVALLDSFAGACPLSYSLPTTSAPGAISLYDSSFNLLNGSDTAGASGTLVIESFKTTAGAEQISFKCTNCSLPASGGSVATVAGQAFLK